MNYLRKESVMPSTVLKRFSSIFIGLLWCLVFLTAAKILFVGYDIDEQYAVTMSYRLLQGDFPVLTMWEPHQTSGFAAALFMLPFLKLTGSTTGIVLYLRFCGLLLHSLVTFFLYRLLSVRLSKHTSLLLCAISFFSLPKLMFLPEFSNLQLWFLFLLIFCFLAYYQTGKKRPLPYLAGAGFFLAMEVLTYPSTILIFPVCLILLFQNRTSGKGFWKELALFLLPCMVSAGIFLGILLSKMSVATLLRLIPVVASDGSHSASLAERLSSNITSLGKLGCFFLLYAAITAILYYSMRWVQKQAKPEILFLCCTLLGQVLLWIFGNFYPNYPSAEYFFVPLIGVLLWGTHKFQKAKFSKKEVPDRSLIFSFFVLLPFVAFLGIVLFTNHPLMVSAPFLSPCVIGLLLLYARKEPVHPKGTTTVFQKTLLLWVLVLLFGKCYLIRTTGGVHYTCFDSLSLMRQGPAAGILADTETVCQYRDTYALVQEVLPAGARVFYAGSSNDLYLMQDLEICSPSTISSPTFDEKIDLYFTENPSKEPEYVVCDTGLLSNPYFVSYLEAHCEDAPLAENDYVLIYRQIR